MNDDANENNAACDNINSNKTITSKSFKYKTKLIGRTPNNDNISDAEVVFPLKYLSNFWRFLDFPLINCNIELDLTWSKSCVLLERSIKSAIAGNPRATPPVPGVGSRKKNGATFQINNGKLYVPVLLCVLIRISNF